ncbi:LamB/YcsF family protein [Beutenbergia cavernae DSM 12333]|uniref:LamB/YcsF family protein n=1 Tax=Beutenbergia cavernae (strain ATCC BAA-8 / DSM 12333 / CCUG 43141 / JCM 11478 / NBRC 16432 / NCIMB 13614 / HKI 0122) TaxID=471853 RepID=C5C2F0_BEUC1|nr:5-oxoprolinase subunit PxpA [Beutenbergia cavernae]ACQ79636.1 LamB/YcsF family protein [Beutenbergia cavernae DSM 12333]
MSPAASTVDLNADLGEGVGDDAAMLDVVTSASIACGGHAGDADTMRVACERALERGVTVGAHPSYEDREGFGRRPQDVDWLALAHALQRQVRDLEEAATAVGTHVAYLKPHGALYHAAASDPRHAGAVLVAAHESLDRVLPVLGLPGSVLERAAADAGVRFVPEAFADRASTPDGQLVPRSEPGAVLTDPDGVADHVLALAPAARSICVHGDTPGAVAIARAARAALEGAGIELVPFAA